MSLSSCCGESLELVRVFSGGGLRWDYSIKTYVPGGVLLDTFKRCAACGLRFEVPMSIGGVSPYTVLRDNYKNKILSENSVSGEEDR